MRHATRWPLLLLLLIVAACRSGAPRGPEEMVPPTTLRVDNQGFADMNIYALRSGGERIRLGRVTGHTVEVFTLPSYIATSGRLRFLADPIGSNRTPVSDEISVTPGDQLNLVIPPS